MSIPHQVELFIVTAKDKRPKHEDVTHACTTPHGYLTFAKKSGRSIMNNDIRDLYVFRLQIPLDVVITTPEELEAELTYAPLIGLHGINEPSRVKFIRCGKFRFKNEPVDVQVDENTVVSVYPEAVRIS